MSIADSKVTEEKAPSRASVFASETPFITGHEYFQPEGVGLSAVADVLRLFLTHPEELLVARDYYLKDRPVSLYVADVGEIWLSDEGKIGALFENAQRLWWEQVKSDVRGNDEKERALAYWYRRIADPATLKRAINAVATATAKLGLWDEQTDEGIFMMADEDDPIPGLTAVRVSQLDADKSLIGTPEGAVDLNTGELLPEGETKKKYLTLKIPDAYNPNAYKYCNQRQKDAVDAIITHPSLSGGYNDYLWQVLGFALRGVPAISKYVCVLYDTNPGGRGDSGKSTLMEILGIVLGSSRRGEIESDAFKKNPNNVGGATSAREQLALCRIGYCEETSHIDLDMGILKKITGGDELTYRVEWERPQSRPVMATVFLLSNGFPRLDLKDESVMSRVVAVRYPAIPTKPVDLRIKDLRERFKGDENRVARQAVFAHLVKYAVSTKEPPEMPPSLITELDEMVDAVRTETERWVRDWIDVTNKDADITFVEDIHKAVAKSKKKDYQDMDNEEKGEITTAVRKYAQRTKKRLYYKGRRGNGFEGVFLRPMSKRKETE